MNNHKDNDHERSTANMYAEFDARGFLPQESPTTVKGFSDFANTKQQTQIINGKEHEWKLVKYIKIVPRKFKENFELRFHDVVTSGNTLKKDLHFLDETRKEFKMTQKERAELMARREVAASCGKPGRRQCSTKKKFDLVDLENQAFSQLYVAPPEDKNVLPGKENGSKLKVSRYPRTTLPTELKRKFELDSNTKSLMESIDSSTRRQTLEPDTHYNDEFWR